MKHKSVVMMMEINVIEKREHGKPSVRKGVLRARVKEYVRAYPFLERGLSTALAKTKYLLTRVLMDEAFSCMIHHLDLSRIDRFCNKCS